MSSFLLLDSNTFATPAASPAPQWQTELGIGAPFPVDSAVTYNGRRSAVPAALPPTGAVSASYTNGITMWNLATPGAPAAPLATFTALGEGIDLNNSFGYWPSDCIELTNTRGVAIGSGISSFSGGPTHDTTYIDVFDAGTSPAMIQRHVVEPKTSTTAQGQRSGYANDVTISRDGAVAIVNADNYFFIVDLASGILKPTNIGYDAGPFPTGDARNLCSPNGAVDSIAMNNETAVITTARLEDNGGFMAWKTWVYLLDVDTNSVALAHKISPSGLDMHFKPHDVTVTPDGTMAVVTTDRVVALFDLVGRQYWGLDENPYARRNYQEQVDSVEVTNDRAVVLSDYVSVPGGPHYWMVDIYRLDAVNTPHLTHMGTYIDPNWQVVGARETRSHDLEIAPGDTKAVVRTSFDNIFITDLANPPLQTALPSLPSPNGSDAHAYRNYSAYRAFSSDSVVIGPLTSDSQLTPATWQTAMTIGGTVDINGIFSGHVDFIDLSASTTTVVQRIITSGNPGLVPGGLPLDLTMTRGKDELVVRCADKFVDPSLASGADVSFFSTVPPFLALQGYGGSGYVMALDSVVAGADGNTRKRIVSTSEDPIAPDGKVHIVDRP